MTWNQRHLKSPRRTIREGDPVDTILTLSRRAMGWFIGSARVGLGRALVTDLAFEDSDRRPRRSTWGSTQAMSVRPGVRVALCAAWGPIEDPVS
jgi:hypothetical protein